MQWNHGVNFGFSNASPEKLYIPTDDKPNSPTVEDQINDPDSLYHEVKKLIAIRRANSALLSDGDIEFVSDGADGALYDGKRAWNLLFGQRAAGAEGARRQTLPDDGRIRLPGGQALP